MKIQHIEAKESTKLTKQRIIDKNLTNLNAAERVSMYNLVLDQLRQGGKDPYLDSLNEKRLVLEARIDIEQQLRRANPDQHYDIAAMIIKHGIQTSNLNKKVNNDGQRLAERL